MTLCSPSSVTIAASEVGGKVYSALRVPPEEKITQRTSTAARVYTKTTGHLLITDKLNKRQFLLYACSDLCVYLRRLIPWRNEHVNYDLCAANCSTIPTHGWLSQF
jgi:hypothetical protein